MLSDAVSILRMIHDGGYWAVTAILAAAWWYERRQNDAFRADNRQLQDKVFDLAKTQIQSNIKQEAALDALKDVLHALIGKNT